MGRNKYWDESYYRYWKERTVEADRCASSRIVPGDAKTTETATYTALIDDLRIRPNDSVLEIGCGFGRSFGHLLSKTGYVVGVDISAPMVRAAGEDYGEAVKGLTVAEAERLPLRDEVFSRVVCFAVFDALYQKEALIEINRVLKPGGTLLVTGKNDDYFDDDAPALEAEHNARLKGHPNYFTDIKGFLGGAMEWFGFRAVKTHFFARRGDLSVNRETAGISVPRFFYEYALVLEKVSGGTGGGAAMLPEIASVESRTFRRVRR